MSAFSLEIRNSHFHERFSRTSMRKFIAYYTVHVDVNYASTWRSALFVTIIEVVN